MSSDMEEKYKEEEQILLSRIKQGDAEAVGKLGDHLYFGISGEESNIDQALPYYKMASDYGSIYYTYRTGLMIEHHGCGDKETAMSYINKAAEAGDIGAQAYLGFEYLDKDQLISLRWFQKAAVQGDAQAMYYVARLYMENDSLPTRDEFDWMVASYVHGYDEAVDVIKDTMNDDPDTSEMVEESIKRLKDNGFPKLRDYN